MSDPAALPAVLAEVLSKLMDATLPSPTAPAFYDVTACPIGEHAARQAIKRGDLQGYRVGQKTLVQAEDLHEFIRKHPIEPAARPRKLDDVDEALAAGGMARRGP